MEKNSESKIVCSAIDYPKLKTTEIIRIYDFRQISEVFLKMTNSFQGMAVIKIVQSRL